ncbi:hypothetical protein BpHYR1_042822 [Brachionus plicatilis]|uniref:Uncharacterized protein n=1 Tax=Brachionus plicatilis TaxID=10195 RepID=A0A3M7Q3X5_BRAPC|nr:hypothetical protein BpHYR1_042822 [Brachionus plicatilis]
MFEALGGGTVFDVDLIDFIAEFGTDELVGSKKRNSVPITTSSHNFLPSQTGSFLIDKILNKYTSIMSQLIN